MKKNRSILLALALLAGMYSCQKSGTVAPDATPDNQNNTGSIQKHGLGAKLNPTAFKNMRHINFDEVRARMIKLGFQDKLPNAKLGGPAGLPTRLILNHPSIGDQGQTGTCVSWSAGWALSGTLNNEFPAAGVSNPRSPWYVYQKDHSAAGNCDPNDGMYLDAGLNILRDYGVPTYAADSYLGSPCTSPTAAQDLSASSDKIVNYAAVTTVNEIKTAISMRLPVILGFNVYTSFETAFSYGTTFKRISGQYLGGHAVCIVGYDDAKNAVLIQNSWGTGGGDPSNRGCVWIDYSTITNPNLGAEMYSVWK
ncbi:C1 family peptidase [Chitinophaga nivalis]|uniref:C1 family peptidase n=1 Tax=Chitinophaga nivalis TaxID=2991709 RepID=A0ABT3IQQ6_9BACT|nr:C1 family peptidase [Chitinophaga nivalis]MCW3463984.1 C1 family peptidase [Chitinophaga nivalis]MCW3486326.1 C1 family peptidase [Chitinophaga nivalis]